METATKYSIKDLQKYVKDQAVYIRMRHGQKTKILDSYLKVYNDKTVLITEYTTNGNVDFWNTVL